MARVIRIDQSVNEVSPKNGTDFSLEEMRELVGCRYIEIVRLKGGLLMVIDEEGKLVGKTPNYIATVLYGNEYDYIVGTALVCRDCEIR